MATAAIQLVELPPVPSDNLELLDAPLNDLDLTVRTVHALTDLGVKTFGQLLEHDLETVLELAQARAEKRGRFDDEEERDTWTQAVRSELAEFAAQFFPAAQ